jgi:bifunctional DNase/RNase
MKDMREAEIWTILRTEQGRGVLLKPLDLDVFVPIFVDRLEAQSILNGLDGIKTERPLSHDLFLTLAAKTGILFERVEVWDLKQDVFYARLVLFDLRKSGMGSIIMDARPSDALVLAARVRCPLFVSARVIDKAGVPAEALFDPLDLEAPGRPPPESGRPPALPKEEKSLARQLEEAVAAEEYERAAELRDKLKGTPDNSGF